MPARKSPSGTLESTSLFPHFVMVQPHSKMEYIQFPLKFCIQHEKSYIFFCKFIKKNNEKTTCK